MEDVFFDRGVSMLTGGGGGGGARGVTQHSKRWWVASNFGQQFLASSFWKPVFGKPVFGNPFLENCWPKLLATHHRLLC